MKTEAGLRNRVKELEVFCTEMEQNRMVLLSELQDAKVCHSISAFIVQSVLTGLVNYY